MGTDRELLEAAELRSTLRYDEITGEFYWLKSNSNCVKVGSKAGKGRNSHGYAEIKVNGRRYKAHRLAWLYVYSEWPDQIDHINGVRHDNRIENLRSVSSKANTHNQRKAHVNSTTGVLGVVAKPSGKFVAEIRVNGKKKHIGTFDTAGAASAAYQNAKIQFHEGAIR
jgi:hypothetical protein